MKRLIIFIMLFMIVLTAVNINSHAEYENDYLDLSANNNYIFANVGDSFDITHIRYADYFGKVTLDEGNIENLSTGLSLADETLTVLDTGVLSLDFTYAGLTNTIYVMSKSTETEQYMLYEEDFDMTYDGFLPLGINVTDGDADVQNHKMNIDSVDGTTKLQFPTLLKVFSNYTVSMDFSFEETNLASRWFAVMFRGSGYNFYQVVFRQGGSVSNGIELNKSTNGSISSLGSSPFTSEFAISETYHLDIEVIGSHVTVKIDNVEFLSIDGLTDYATGYIGMQANGNVAAIDNIQVAYDNSEGTEHQFMSVPRLYELDSNANQTPTVIQEMDSLEDVEVLSQVMRPHVAVFTIDDNLNVLDSNGDVMMTAYEALVAADVVAIPAFRIPSSEAGIALAELLESNRILDVYVMSDHYEDILDAHETYEYIKGVLEVPYDEEKSALSDEDLNQIKVDALTSFSFVVWLDQQYLNQDTVTYFHHRLLQVWASDGSSSKGEVSKVIFSGADGIVTTSEFMVVSVLNELPENTSLYEPMLIGHRGMPAHGPENTVESSQLAFDSGADAVELDIRLTLDDKIVVMHDASTARTTGVSLTVSQATYDEITSLEVINYFDELGTVHVPGLEDYFIAFENVDKMLIIEIKDTDTLIVEKMSELLESYPAMRDKIIVISFDHNQLYAMKEAMPDVPLAYLNGEFSANDIQTTIENHLKLYVPMGAISNVHYGSLWDEYLLAFHHRGISTTTWTVNDETLLQDYYLDGLLAITTDIAYALSDTWNQFKINETQYTFDLNESVTNDTFTIRGNIYTNDMDVYPHNPSYVIIDDGGTNLTIENGQIMSASNTGTAYIKTMFETTLPDGRTMTLYGDVITVEVIDTTVIETPSHVGLIVGIVTGSIVILAGVGFILLKKGLIKFK